MISRTKFGPGTHEQECSRDNLLCYLALRKHDISDLQIRLDQQGLSSLGMIESNVLFSMEQVLKHFGITASNRERWLLLKKAMQY